MKKSVKWPPNVVADLKDRFSDLPTEVFERMFEHSDSAIARTLKPSPCRLMIDIPNADTLHAITLHWNFTDHGENRLVRSFSGAHYALPLQVPGEI